jgi:hypothetical protein
MLEKKLERKNEESLKNGVFLPAAPGGTAAPFFTASRLHLGLQWGIIMCGVVGKNGMQLVKASLSREAH